MPFDTEDRVDRDALAALSSSEDETMGPKRHESSHSPSRGRIHVEGTSSFANNNLVELFALANNMANKSSVKDRLGEVAYETEQ